MGIKSTPNRIAALSEYEIFVFGSRPDGLHTEGAARTAYERFGAVMGQGSGLQGQSYAIPTCGKRLDEIKTYVGEFLKLAGDWDETIFYVTRIGCGRSGFTDEEIAPLFDAAIDGYNVILPRTFLEIIVRNRRNNGRKLPFGFEPD